jgi:subtilisin family serine protease
VVRVDRFLPPATDDAIAQTHNLARVSSETNALVGSRIVLYRFTDQRTVTQVAAELRADPRVQASQPNWRYEASQGASVPAAPELQYAVVKIRLAGAQALAKGAGVKVAVIDSGVDALHPDLKGSVVRVFDATRGEGRPDDMHGTAIAGIIRGRGAIRGIAPEARLLAARAFFQTDGYDGDQSSTVIVMRALDWSVASGAKVINMSFAGPPDEGLAEAVDRAAKQGVIMVAAAGNGGPQAKPAYPAAYADVIAVTATDADDRLYEKANRGSYLTVAAPGVDVYVTAPNKRHRFSTGTSMAAAHVSGLVALMLERNRELTIADVREAIVRTARDLGARGIDVQFGAGRIDAAALLHGMKVPTGPPVSIADRDR